jgi:hypothetical protein
MQFQNLKWIICNITGTSLYEDTSISGHVVRRNRRLSLLIILFCLYFFFKDETFELTSNSGVIYSYKNQTIWEYENKTHLVITNKNGVIDLILTNIAPVQ